MSGNVVIYKSFADLHCDLLYYLQAEGQHTPFDPVVRCSLPQLQKGGVRLQTMAVFVETNAASVRTAMAQVNIFKNLPLLYPNNFSHSPLYTDGVISLLMAVENASGLCDEDEPIQFGLDRLKLIAQTCGKPLYVSLTWNSENRFGGGALTAVGLKEDGKRLLEVMYELQIAVDLSHASDALAYDILEFLDSQKLDLPVIASHSNSRAILNVPRNLTDDLAQEIFRRKGVIGLNLFKAFVGSDPEAFAQHISRWISLGGAKHICFGADFFDDRELFHSGRYPGVAEFFFPDYANASCYGQLTCMIQQQLNLSEEALSDLSLNNMMRFINESTTESVFGFELNAKMQRCKDRKEAAKGSQETIVAAN
jgi:microsomal dipeptidase-like Zn-dependent dipeptidase